MTVFLEARDLGRNATAGSSKAIRLRNWRERRLSLETRRRTIFKRSWQQELKCPSLSALSFSNLNREFRPPRLFGRLVTLRRRLAWKVTANYCPSSTRYIADARHGTGLIGYLLSRTRWPSLTTGEIPLPMRCRIASGTGSPPWIASHNPIIQRMVGLWAIAGTTIHS